jgi:hypothetical protein
LPNAPPSTLIAPPITFPQLPDPGLEGVTVVGRKEILQAIRILCLHYNTHFVNVSDEVGFPWRRWLCNLVLSREIVGAGIVQVHAVSSLRDHGATSADWSWPYSDFIALHRQDQSLCFVNPKTQKYTMTDPLQFIQNYKSENDAERFQNAVVAVQSWLTLRTM